MTFQQSFEFPFFQNHGADNFSWTEWQNEREATGAIQIMPPHSWCDVIRGFLKTQRSCVHVRFRDMSANLHVLSSPTVLLYFLLRLVESLSLTWHDTTSIETRLFLIAAFILEFFSILKASRVSVEITASILTCVECRIRNRKLSPNGSGAAQFSG